jgi:IclR family acetate operon transcriptional repressor
MTKWTSKNPTIPPVSEGTSRTVKSDETLIAIIECLTEKESAGLSEIANELGMAKSSVHKHLTTLHQHRFLLKDDGQYSIGLRFLEIGQIARGRRAVYTITQPKVARLAEETGEVACCIVEENGLGIFLCLAEGEHAVQHDAWIGKAMHLHYLSGGLTMMAHMPDEEVHTILEKYGLPEKTEQTITDTETLFEEFENIRQQKYYVDSEESVEGLSTVSAPIVDDSDHPVAALTVAGPAQRFIEEYVHDEIRPSLLTAVNEAELDFKYL